MNEYIEYKIDKEIDIFKKEQKNIIDREVNKNIKELEEQINFLSYKIKGLSEDQVKKDEITRIYNFRIKIFNSMAFSFSIASSILIILNYVFK